MWQKNKNLHISDYYCLCTHIVSLFILRENKYNNKRGESVEHHSAIVIKFYWEMLSVT